MTIRLRITTKAATYEQRKRQHVEAGYKIEQEQPLPVNGLCSFVAVMNPDSSQKSNE
jgi:hypothetical protein